MLTSHHVIEGQARVDAAPQSGSRQVQVIRQFATDDLALLGDHPSWTEHPLDLLGARDLLQPGEVVWALGLPSGWQGHVPVVSNGVVAATSPELWVTTPASWSHSGGPLLVERNGSLTIAGIVLGHGGQSRHDLRSFIAQVRQVAATIKAHVQNPNTGSATLAGIDFKNLALYLSDTLTVLSDFVDAHFRSGFVRALDHRTIRALLGW